MTERTIRVYRLDIVYPEGSLKPGWQPACWGALLRDIKDRGQRRAVRERGFRWPRERLFLSASAARHRALLLQWFGADVIVQPSERVTWWEDNADAMDWWPDEAAGFSLAAADVAWVLAGVFPEEKWPQ